MRLTFSYATKMQLDEGLGGEGGEVSNLFHCNSRLITRQEKNGRSL